jgi:AcrR family transcriptional regulator
MASKRNVEDEILDAARDCVEAFGIRRTTLTDVARRAEVSRPTVYRRWPDVTALVADLLTRELRRILVSEEAQAELRPQEAGTATDADGDPAATENVRTRLVRHATRVARAMLAHPLVNRIVDTEPELLLTYTFHRLGSSHRAALELIEPAVATGQAEGSVREGDPGVLAHLFMVTVQNTVTSHRLFADVLTQDELVSELSVLLDGYLRP